MGEIWCSLDTKLNICYARFCIWLSPLLLNVSQSSVFPIREPRSTVENIPPFIKERFRAIRLKIPCPLRMHLHTSIRPISITSIHDLRDKTRRVRAPFKRQPTQESICPLAKRFSVYRGCYRTHFTYPLKTKHAI